MTAYEIMELRTMFAERLVTLSKFWLTATFAAFAGAFYVGSGLDSFSAIALMVFHGIVCFMVVMAMTGVSVQMSSLALDAADCASKNTDAPHVIGIDIVVTPPTLTRTFGLIIGSFVALLFYVLQQSGLAFI
jgi:hypothetical protein